MSDLCAEKNCDEPAPYGMTWRIDGVALEFYLCEGHFDAIGGMSTDTRPELEPDAARSLIRWMSPWIDREVFSHGARLSPAELALYRTICPDSVADFPSGS